MRSEKVGEMHLMCFTCRTVQTRHERRLHSYPPPKVNDRGRHCCRDTEGKSGRTLQRKLGERRFCGATLFWHDFGEQSPLWTLNRVLCAGDETSNVPPQIVGQKKLLFSFFCWLVFFVWRRREDDSHATKACGAGRRCTKSWGGLGRCPLLCIFKQVSASLCIQFQPF